MAFILHIGLVLVFANILRLYAVALEDYPNVIAGTDVPDDAMYYSNPDAADYVVAAPAAPQPQPLQPSVATDGPTVCFTIESMVATVTQVAASVLPTPTLLVLTVKETPPVSILREQITVTAVSVQREVITVEKLPSILQINLPGFGNSVMPLIPPQARGCSAGGATLYRTVYMSAPVMTSTYTDRMSETSTLDDDSDGRTMTITDKTTSTTTMFDNFPVTSQVSDNNGLSNGQDDGSPNVAAKIHRRQFARKEGNGPATRIVTQTRTLNNHYPTRPCEPDCIRVSGPQCGATSADSWDSLLDALNRIQLRRQKDMLFSSLQDHMTIDQSRERPVTPTSTVYQQASAISAYAPAITQTVYGNQVAPPSQPAPVAVQPQAPLQVLPQNAVNVIINSPTKASCCAQVSILPTITLSDGISIPDCGNSVPSPSFVVISQPSLLPQTTGANPLQLDNALLYDLLR